MWGPTRIIQYTHACVKRRANILSKVRERSLEPKGQVKLTLLMIFPQIPDYVCGNCRGTIYKTGLLWNFRGRQARKEATATWDTNMPDMPAPPDLPALP